MLKRNLLLLIVLLATILSSFSFNEVLPIEADVSHGGLAKGSSSEKNIDSFNVHPANRWNVVNNGYTATISNGVLVLSDVGDDSADTYAMNRDLRDLDGTVEWVFKYTDNSTSYNWQNSFHLYLYGSDSNKVAYLYLKGAAGSNKYYTYLGFVDENSDLQEELMSTDDYLANDTWYRVRIDYDLLKSELRFRVYSVSEKIIDYVWQDISNVRPAIFASKTLMIRNFLRSYSAGKELCVYLDYVDASFKELEWTNTDVPADSDWLVNSWNQHVVNDDIDDVSEWRLAVPRLDSVSGSMITGFNATASITGEVRSSFKLYGVEANNGTLRCLTQLMIYQAAPSGGDPVGAWLFAGEYGDGSTVDAVSGGATYNLPAKLEFNIYTQADRSVVSISMRFYYDATDSSDYDDLYYTLDVSDYVYDLCNEFVLSFHNDVDFDDDFTFKFLVEDFDLVGRDIFSDVGGFISGLLGGAGDLFQGGVDLFAILFRWLASAILGGLDILGDLIVGAITTMQDTLTAAINLVKDSIDAMAGLIEGAIQAMEATLETAVGLVEDAVGLVEDAIDGVALILEDILDGIASLAADIIAAAIAVMGDVVDAFIIAAGALIADVAKLLGDGFDAVLTFLGLDTLGDAVVSITNDLLTKYIAIVSMIASLIALIYDLVTRAGVFLLAIVWGYIIIVALYQSENRIDWIGNIFSKLDSELPYVSALGFGFEIKWYMIAFGILILEVTLI